LTNFVTLRFYAELSSAFVLKTEELAHARNGFPSAMYVGRGIDDPKRRGRKRI
jgi:hypothetical protein